VQTEAEESDIRDIEGAVWSFMMLRVTLAIFKLLHLQDNLVCNAELRSTSTNAVILSYITIIFSSCPFYILDGEGPGWIEIGMVLLAKVLFVT